MKIHSLLALAFLAAFPVLSGCNTTERFVSAPQAREYPAQTGPVQFCSSTEIKSMPHEVIGKLEVAKTAFTPLVPPSEAALKDEFSSRARQRGADAVVDFSIRESAVQDDAGRTWPNKTAEGTLVRMQAPMSPMKTAARHVLAASTGEEKNPVEKAAPAAAPEAGHEKPAAPTQPRGAVLGTVTVEKQALTAFTSVSDQEVRDALLAKAKKLGADSIGQVEIQTGSKIFDGRTFQIKTGSAQAIKTSR